MSDITVGTSKSLLDKVKAATLDFQETWPFNPANTVFMNEATRHKLTLEGLEVWRELHRPKADAIEWGVQTDTELEPKGEVTHVYGLEILIDNDLSEDELRLARSSLS